MFHCNLLNTANFNKIFYIVAALAVLFSIWSGKVAPAFIAIVAGISIVYANRLSTKESTATTSSTTTTTTSTDATTDKAAFAASSRAPYPPTYGLSDYADDVMSRTTRNRLGGEPLEVRDRLVEVLYNDEQIGRSDPYMKKIEKKK